MLRLIRSSRSLEVSKEPVGRSGSRISCTESTVAVMPSGSAPPPTALICTYWKPL